MNPDPHTKTGSTGVVDDSPASARAEDGGPRAPTQPMSIWVMAGFPVVTILAAGFAYAFQGAGGALVVLAGGALVVGIAMFWASLRVLVGEAPLLAGDAYAIGVPTTEQEQKIAVVRALKSIDLSAASKISEGDYVALIARYRVDAKRLLRILDERASPGRQRVEALLHERLLQEGLLASEPGSTGSTNLVKASHDSEGVEKRLRNRPIPVGAAVESALRAVGLMPGRGDEMGEGTRPREGGPPLCARCEAEPKKAPGLELLRRTAERVRWRRAPACPHDHFDLGVRSQRRAGGGCPV